VRKAGTRVRIAGQLIDTLTRTHLWADRRLEDIFETSGQNRRQRRRGDRAASVILSTSAVPTVAQAPTPATTAFDAKYVGTGPITHENSSDAGLCRTITSVDMVDYHAGK
jgi:hypothetical protein